MVKRKRLLVLFIIVLSFGLLITGCSSSSSDKNSYIIGGNVTVDEGNVEDVTLRIDDDSGISTDNPDSNGKWNAVVSEGYVTVTPFYDRNGDYKNDYDFVPSSWSKYVGADRTGIGFTGTYIYSRVQEMLGEWEFTYDIGSNTYIEYYVFNTLVETDTGQHYAHGYKKREYSSSTGNQDYGPEYPAVASYFPDREIFTVLWMLPDESGYGSYFEFEFYSSTTVSGQYYMITDGTLESPDPMTGLKEPLSSSALSTEDNDDDNKAQQLFNQLIQKHEESKEVSTTSDVNDADKKIEIKEKVLSN